MTDNPLAEVLRDLYGLLGAREDGDGELQRRIAERLQEEELDDPQAPPTWLLDVLTAVRDRQLNGWIDFQRPETDDTNVLDFIRGLPDVIPVTYENNEESWIIGFPALDVDLGISWEGSCYKVSKTGATWE